MSKCQVTLYEFGSFRIDLQKHLLLEDEKPTQLSPKVLQTLLVLIQNRDRVVTKAEILSAVWPDTYVDESNVAQNVFILRRLLRDEKTAPRYIVTISGTGYRFVAPVSEIYAREVSSPPARKRAQRGQTHSVAVLPLLNASPDKEMEYLSDGITESIINSLTQLPKLRIVPRSTVFHYKNTQSDPQEIGRELGVQVVLTGRVMLFGERLMVNVELIDVDNESQLWGEQYNRKLADIFEVQEDISKRISHQLLLELSGEERKRLSKRHTHEAEAYRHYLRGRFHWNKRTEESFKKGIGHFLLAIESDPTYAMAYAGLADSYILLGFYGALAPDDAMPKAKAAAMKALELDDSLAEPHTSLAYIQSVYEWNWRSSEKEFKKAIRLNPKYATARHWYAFNLAARGRLPEALREIKLARDLDPLALIINAEVGWAYYFGREYDKAIEQYQKAIEMDSGFSVAYMFLGMSYLQQKKFKEAISTLRRAVELSGGSLLMKAVLGHVQAKSGDHSAAKQIIKELASASPERYVSPYNIAILYAGLGDTDNTIAQLEEAQRQRALFLAWMNVEPMFDSVRVDHRFAELVRRIGLMPEIR